MKSAVWGIGFIVFGALSMIVSSYAPLSFILEIATLLIAILVSGICLFHIYAEHDANHQKEKKLKHSLLTQIYSLDPTLPCCKILYQYIELRLDNHDLPERLKILQSWQQDQVTLQHFIVQFWQCHTFKETLKDLGLSW